MSSASTAAATVAAPSWEEASRRAGDVTGWLGRHWESWLAAGLRIVLILVIALVVRALLRRAISRLVERMNRAPGRGAGGALGGLLVNAERRRQRAAAIGSVLRSVASFLVLGTAALTVLSVLRIDLAPLLASAGVAGVALGFGARNLVMDMLSGMFMLLEDQYGVGDRVDAGDATGEVLEIGLRVTKLRGDDGEIWYVRNGEISRIGNLSQGWSTATVDVEVPADEDLRRVERVIAEAGADLAADESWQERLWGPVEVLGVETLTLEAMTVRTAVRTVPGQSTAVARELRRRIKLGLDAAGVRCGGSASSPVVPEQPAPARTASDADDGDD